MHHHFSIYLQILGLFAKNEQVLPTFQKAKSMQELGFYAKKIINVDFAKPVHEYEPIMNQNG